MPELPEVETVVRDLRPLLVGRRFASALKVTRQKLRKRWSAAWSDRLVGRRVAAVGRRGKWILLDLDPAGLLVVHLGMTGQLTVVDAAETRADHTHLVFDLDDGVRQLRYRDVRRFGSATLYADRTEVDAFFAGSSLGPEPFGLVAEDWRQRLTSTKRSLKAALLDQRLVAGVGNIYADESLFEARLHPARRARDLSAKEAERLRLAIASVLGNAIEHRGSTIRDYIGGSGLRGGYQEEFRVYGRTGEPCRQCRTPITCVRLAGRSSHFCPQCQPAGRSKADN